MNKGRANRKWRRDNVRSRRLSNHKWRRIPTLTWRRNVVAAEMLIQRRSHVALRRLNNLLSTSFVVVLTLIQRCLDVTMRRWNNVVFRRRINISIATVSRRHSDVGIQRWNDVDTTSLCLLGGSILNISNIFNFILSLLLYFHNNSDRSSLYYCLYQFLFVTRYSEYMLYNDIQKQNIRHGGVT